MSTPKGYPTQEKDDRLKAQFVTIEPIREKQFGMSVAGHLYVYAVGVDAVEAGSTEYIINLTAHSVLVGDVIRFTSGALIGQEVKVATIPDANSIELAETLSVAPSAADSIQVLRHKYPVVDSDGLLQVTTSQGPVQFRRDGVPQEVIEDTGTPANNRPLPVKLTDFSGDMVLNATNLNLEVQLDHNSATPDSIQIGDGTEIMAINASNEAQVRDDDANTTLTSIDGKILTYDLDTGGGTENVPGVNLRFSANGGSVEAGTVADPIRIDPVGTTSQPVVGNVADNAADSGNPVKAGAIYEAALPTYDDGDRSTLHTNVSGELLTRNSTAEASLSSIDAGIPAALGQAAMAASMPVVVASDQSSLPTTPDGSAAANAADSGNPIKVGAVYNAALPTYDDGDRTNLQSDVNGKLLTSDTVAQASLAAIDAGIPSALGQAAMAASMPVVIASDQSSVPVSVVALSQKEFVRNDYTGTAVTTAAYVQLIASLAFDVKEIEIFDSSGETLKLALGAAASEVDQLLVFPGGNGRIPFSASATDRLSIRAVSANATVGEVSINLYG